MIELAENLLREGWIAWLRFLNWLGLLPDVERWVG